MTCHNEHIEELHNLYSSPNIVRISKPMKMRLTGHVAHIRRRKINRKLVEKPERKRPLGRRRRR
jgi:hypothetical protein